MTSTITPADASAKPTNHRTPGSLKVVPSSKPDAGTLWRDIVSTEGPYSPSYVGEALEDDARMFVASLKMLVVLKGAQSALRKALPFLPADAEAVFIGEWLDEVNAVIAEAEGVK